MWGDKKIFLFLQFKSSGVKRPKSISLNEQKFHLIKFVYSEKATKFEKKSPTSFQTMTEAEHNWPIPKLFSNRPSASAAEVFGLLKEPIIFFENNM